MLLLLDGIGAALIAAGLIAALVLALPGIPLIFGGIWLIAGVDRYRRLGVWWLLGIVLVGLIGVTLDLLAGALGAKRVGASKHAVGGASSVPGATGNADDSKLSSGPLFTTNPW